MQKVEEDGKPNTLDYAYSSLFRFIIVVRSSDRDVNENQQQQVARRKWGGKAESVAKTR